jgi:hypothetical protein
VSPRSNEPQPNHSLYRTQPGRGLM